MEDNIGFYISDNKWIGTDYTKDLTSLRRLAAAKDSYGDILLALLDLVENGVFVSSDENLGRIRFKHRVDNSEIIEMLWTLIRVKVFHHKDKDRWYLHNDFIIVKIEK